MKINSRLKKIGDLVEANSFCLDVGCDHALLDIYLVKKKVSSDDNMFFVGKYKKKYYFCLFRSNK